MILSLIIAERLVKTINIMTETPPQGARVILFLYPLGRGKEHRATQDEPELKSHSFTRPPAEHAESKNAEKGRRYRAAFAAATNPPNAVPSCDAMLVSWSK